MLSVVASCYVDQLFVVAVDVDVASVAVAVAAAADVVGDSFFVDVRDDFDFDESDEPRTARQSSTYSGPVISFYRPGVDSDSDENEEDDDDSEFEFEKEEEGAYGQKFNKVEDDGSEVWKDSDYESEGGVEADPSVMRDLGF